jgi:hypothetical protein
MYLKITMCCRTCYVNNDKKDSVTTTQPLNIYGTYNNKTITWNYYWNCVRFEVFTAVTMKNAVFWDVVTCRSCVNRRFGGTYRLHLYGRKIRERGTNVKIHLLLTLFLCSRIFLPWRLRRYVLPKCRFTQDLHGATSQKTAFFLLFELFFRKYDVRFGFH